jgi:hypothetical protein
MAKRDVRHADADLYERDYYAWVQRQLELLRAGRLQDVDLDNLIEEIEDLGRSERKVVRSQARNIIHHLLKLHHSPAVAPRRQWRKTEWNARGDLEDDLTPTLRHDLERELPHLYALAAGATRIDLEEDMSPVPDLPPACPYTLDQILDRDWLPEDLHLVRDGAE